MTVSASTKWAAMLMPSNTHKHQICVQVTMSSWSRKRQSTPYTPLPYVITHKKGTMITTQCGDKDAQFSLNDKEEDDNIGKIMPSTPQLIQQQPSLQSQSHCPYTQWPFWGLCLHLPRHTPWHQQDQSTTANSSILEGLWPDMMPALTAVYMLHDCLTNT